MLKTELVKQIQNRGYSKCFIQCSNDIATYLTNLKKFTFIRCSPDTDISNVIASTLASCMNGNGNNNNDDKEQNIGSNSLCIITATQIEALTNQIIFANQGINCMVTTDPKINNKDPDIKVSLSVDNNTINNLKTNGKINFDYVYINNIESCKKMVDDTNYTDLLNLIIGPSTKIIVSDCHLSVDTIDYFIHKNFVGKVEVADAITILYDPLNTDMNKYTICETYNEIITHILNSFNSNKTLFIITDTDDEGSKLYKLASIKYPDATCKYYNTETLDPESLLELANCNDEFLNYDVVIINQSQYMPIKFWQKYFDQGFIIIVGSASNPVLATDRKESKLFNDPSEFYKLMKSVKTYRDNIVYMYFK